MEIEYIVTGIVLLAFAGFLAYKLRDSKKSKGTTSGVSGGGGFSKNNNTQLK